MDPRIESILINTEELDAGIKRASDYINQTYQHNPQPPIIIGILKGCIPFIGKLLPGVSIDVELDFLTVTSYHGIQRNHNVKIVTDLVTNVENRDVILVEDVVDTANTIAKISDLIRMRKARSLRIVTLLDKPSQRLQDLKVDFACFTIEPHFVVGFGLDYLQLLRNLPYIGILKPEVYKKKK
ncbi:hypoxanthine phosphoribosyltransferase [Mycoplasmoides fastidiosum]|uniref:Hypoxanthine phosphoribosyltransferase n=1 Tax=Mycoplasmoides fastidiosum TaxID=92758 RepID=A0ABU0LYF0_9BACT|nr:hypoxanthine phosphoribosyltransferase [Mycoplasmoides fastidiosum]MDQ0513732.1 hypoxanthine phosphoribosyltransferase [Mycoplasmoides fastidiosum]UUD37846.1 hypoxanthine phosphoribosyltransferase [Mycoplasmoides fastidiosum]